MKKIKYPPELIDKVKELFPKHAELHNALDSGSVKVGSYLFKLSNDILHFYSEWAWVCQRTFKKDNNLSKLKYPQKFISDVKKILPTYTGLHKSLDAGDVCVGQDIHNAHIEISNIIDEWDEIFGETL